VPEIMICTVDNRADLEATGGYHSYDLNAGFSPNPGNNNADDFANGQGYQAKYWVKYGAPIPGFTYSDVVMMVDKWPGQSEWHLDVDTFPNALNGGSGGIQGQWYRLIFNSPAGPPYKKQYKHGKAGNNYLYLDFSVRNEDPGFKYNWQWAPHQVLRGTPENTSGKPQEN
jgi:hypothetical protein